MSFWQSLFSQPDRKRHSDNKATSENSRATQIDLQGLIQLRYKSSYLALGSQRKAYSALSGNYSSAFKGRGLNFDEVRPYQPGDDIRNIDWNVTARTDKVHTKIFKEERERPVFIIVDFSSSMFFGTRQCLKSVTAAKAAALIAWAGADHCNRIGGMVFNQNSHMEMRPKGGHQGVLRFLKLLTDFHNDPDKSVVNHTESHRDKLLDANMLFARIQKLIHPGRIVLFASDFSHMDDVMLKHLQHIASHNDLLLTHVYDILETELPPAGYYGISNGENYQLLNTGDRSLRESFKDLFQEKIEHIEQFCLKNQIHLIRLATHDKVADQFLATLGKDSGVRRIARSRH